MDRRNRCLEELTESLQRSLRESVGTNRSAAAREEARRRAEREEWMRRAGLALAAGLTGAALLLPFWG